MIIISQCVGCSAVSVFRVASYEHNYPVGIQHSRLALQEQNNNNNNKKQKQNKTKQKEEKEKRRKRKRKQKKKMFLVDRENGCPTLL